MNKVPTTLWDVAEHLETKEDMAAYLEAALEDGDPNLVVAALGDIARSKGMTNIARETGLGRHSLTALEDFIKSDRLQQTLENISLKRSPKNLDSQ